MGHVVVCDSAKAIEMAFKCTERIYRKMTLLAFVGGLYILSTEIRAKKQNEKIKELTEKVEELKNAKGD